MQEFDFRRLDFRRLFIVFKWSKFLTQMKKFNIENATFHFPFSWGFFRSFFFFCFLLGISFLHYAMIGYEGILGREYNISIILFNFVKVTFGCVSRLIFA